MYDEEYARKREQAEELRQLSVREQGRKESAALALAVVVIVAVICLVLAALRK